MKSPKLNQFIGNLSDKINVINSLEGKLTSFKLKLANWLNELKCKIHLHAVYKKHYTEKDTLSISTKKIFKSNEN